MQDVSLPSKIISEDTEPDAGSDRSSPPTVWNFAHRMLGEAREWWAFSTHRVVADEVRKSPLRISAILKDSLLKYGPAVPTDPRQHGQMSFREECVYGLSCTRDVEQLLQKHPWMGALDQQLAAEAYQLGAAWAFRICKEKDDIEPVQNSCDPPKSQG